MTNDNDLLLLASSQNNGAYKVYIDSTGKKTLTPQTANYTAKEDVPYVYGGIYKKGLLYGKNPKKVKLPNCIKATGNSYQGAFNYAFQDCTSLTSVSFPSLISASGSTSDYAYGEGAFHYAFQGCTSLTSVSFPALTTATGGSGTTGYSSAFEFAFRDCKSLTSVSFPSLTTATIGNTGAFEFAFIDCSPSLKVHFKKSMKGTAKLDYNSMGLKSADQIVFDLD